MHRIITIGLLLLAGCPDAPEVTPEDEPFDFFAGEGTEWRWGTSTCVVYARDGSSGTRARWFSSAQLVRGGQLSGRDTSDDFRRGFYVPSGKLAIEHGDGEGYFVKRFFYDEVGRLVEIVQRRATSTQTFRTQIYYDGANRMIERSTERSSMAPLLERWTYAPIGAVESYTAESNGRTVRTLTVERAPSGRATAMRRSDESRELVFTYDYGDTGFLPVHVHLTTAGDFRSPYDFDYEYDDKNRTIARTLRTNDPEVGERIELVFGDKDVIEKRDLTANGLVRARSTFDRSTNGDVHLSIDSNADGEPDRFADLRDECNGVVVPEFATTFSPRIPLDGEPPYRPDPFVEAQ